MAASQGVPRSRQGAFDVCMPNRPLVQVGPAQKAIIFIAVDDNGCLLNHFHQLPHLRLTPAINAVDQAQLLLRPLQR